MKTSIKKTNTDTQRLPLSNFSQSAVVVLDPDPVEVIKNALVNKVIRRLLSIMSERGSPRASYTAAFKLRVIAYAVSHGNRAAGRWKLRALLEICQWIYEAWEVSNSNKQRLTQKAMRIFLEIAIARTFMAFNDKHWLYQMFTWRTVAAFINYLKYFNIN